MEAAHHRAKTISVQFTPYFMMDDRFLKVDTYSAG
jgi:hypothetical protein